MIRDDDTQFVHGTGPLAKSRSQKKRESTALQKQGETLAELPDRTLKTLALPPELLEALLERRQISDHEGRRRQTQYIGRLMRELEPERLDVLTQNLQLLQNHATAADDAFHALEDLRAALLAPEASRRAEALAETLHKYPKAEDARLVHLVNFALQERESGKKGGGARAFRELFRYLKSL